jgi:ADP-ribose pyrophosphatase YjhB (NUDIX family)
MDIKFCTQCGGSVQQTIPHGDSHARYICSQCGFIHYQNPNVVTGCLVHKNDKVLLCKRSIEPRHGLWTVPAGFMENGESTRVAAQRETTEEAGANIKIKDLFVLANLTHANQVYMLYRAELIDDDFQAGHESSEVKLFDEKQIPWDSIAFYTVRLALEKFCYDYKKGQFSLHEIDC